MQYSYSYLHKKVRKLWGDIKQCDFCSQEQKKTRDGRSYLQLAAISEKYTDNLKDWHCLCPSCHKKYDAKPETRIKISQAKKGKEIKYSPISAKVLYEASQKRKRPVVSIDRNNKSQTYESIKEASLQTNVSAGCIVNACKKKRRTAGGYVWNYLIK